MIKIYENDEIKVFWRPEMCAHAGECVRGNGKVFDPQRRPWVDLSQASAREVASIIDRCPSKALQYELKDPLSVVFSDAKQASVAYLDGEIIGECTFSESNGKWVIAHTSVEPSYEGRGIARRLVLKVVETARERGIKIVPLCIFAQKLLTGKEEFNDILV